MNRRSFLFGAGALAAPAIIRPGVLMPVSVWPPAGYSIIDTTGWGSEWALEPDGPIRVAMPADAWRYYDFTTDMAEYLRSPTILRPVDAQEETCA